MKIPRIAFAAYGFALLIIVLDQLTKAWILSLPDVASIKQIPLGYVFAEVFPPVLRFTFVQNTGVSFGLFGGGEARWGLTIFSVLVSGALAWWATRADRRLLITAIGLVIGGALGNVIDRVRFGYVVDFLDLHFGDFRPFLVFNVADAAITVGVVILLVRALFARPAPAEKLNA